MRTLLTTTAAALLLAAPAIAQDSQGKGANPTAGRGAGSIEDARASAALDENDDGAVSREEFMQNFDVDRSFARFDYDGDGTITEEEYARAMFEAHDVNDSGEWERSEMSAYDRAQLATEGDGGMSGRDAERGSGQSSDAYDETDLEQSTAEGYEGDNETDN